MKIKLTTTILTLTMLTNLAGLCVNDNYTENNTYSPTGGSLSNNLSADGNSANNNGSISSSSSAFANKLDSSIANVSRLENTNQQFGNSSIGNTSNNSAGGYANSGGNTLSNTANGGAGGYSTSNSGGNDLNNSQGQAQGQSSSNTNSTTTSSQGNTTTINGGNTTVQRSAPSLGGNVNFQQVGTTGFNAGLSTIMGGAQLGFNKTNKDAKAFMRAQTEETYQRANAQYVDNAIRACSFLSESDCEELKSRLMNRLQ
jgi:hypothetical protein